MSTTPTNLPVPSEKPQDLKFNAGKIDEFVTSMQREYEDRFGGKHYTIEGLRWVAQQAIAAFGYITMDSFQAGATLTLPNQVLRDTSTGEYYRWDGAFPKDVPAGSTPDSTGGVGIGAWLGVGSAVLSGEFGSEMVGHGNNTVAEVLYAIEDVTKISAMQFTDQTRYTLKSWRPVTATTTELYGGGEFVYVANLDRSKHDGGTIIDVTVPYDNDADYLNGVGSTGGSGCLVRMEVNGELKTSWFGCVHADTGVICTESFQKSIDTAKSIGKLSIDTSIIIDKPAVVSPQLTIEGMGRFKTFIYKNNNTTSGLPDMQAPTDSSPTIINIKYDVDAVLIVKPFNAGEYATSVVMRGFSVENTNNPTSGMMPSESYGIYMPMINLSEVSNIQAYRVGVAFKSFTMWETKLFLLRGFQINNLLWIESGGTSIDAGCLWAHQCYYSPYIIKGVGYSSFIACAADFVGGNEHNTGYVYQIEKCNQTKFDIACEETTNVGVIYIKESNVEVTINAKYGVKGGEHDVYTVAIGSSNVIFTTCDIAVSDTGNQMAFAMSDSKITCINSPYLSANAGVYDENSNVTLIDNGTISVAGIFNTIPFTTAIGKDIVTAGLWDNGRIVFGPGGIYGTLFADGSGGLRYKSSGIPANNSDGTRLN
ncbi:hypothetical protein ACW9T4_003009 [Salmonella enterica subsp. enterica]